MKKMVLSLLLVACAFSFAAFAVTDDGKVFVIIKKDGALISNQIVYTVSMLNNKYVAASMAKTDSSGIAAIKVSPNSTVTEVLKQIVGVALEGFKCDGLPMANGLYQPVGYFLYPKATKFGDPIFLKPQEKDIIVFDMKKSPDFHVYSVKDAIQTAVSNISGMGTKAIIAKKKVEQKLAPLSP